MIFDFGERAAKVLTKRFLLNFPGMNSMNELVHPDFWVEEQSGHPGYHAVRLTGTPKAIANLLTRMSEKLTNSPAIEANSVKNDRGERLLFRTEAIDARAPHKRVTVSFYAATDLNFHHVRPSKRAEFFERHVFLLLWPLLILAFIGGTALLNGFVPW